MRVWAVIPALDERTAIADTVHALVSGLCDGAIVVDGGSRDGTPELARDAGARVVREPRRGYGRAMMRGAVEAERAGAEALLMLDGNGRVAMDDIARVLAPVAAGEADLAVGSRPGASLSLAQRLGNALSVQLIRAATGVCYRDVGSVRAVRAESLRALELDEPTYGWPLQLQVRAAKRGLRVHDVPVSVRARRGGRSKVSGTLRGTAGASLCFLRVLASECRP
jgi:glycosyltransferase involved in cell wall biosynthesis